MNAWLLMPEVYLGIGVLTLLVALGATWAPLLVLAPVLAAIAGALAVRSVTSAARARFPTPDLSPGELLMRRGLAALLYVAQPLVRLEGRLRHGLTPWRRFAGSSRALPVSRRLERWREEWIDPIDWLREFERRIVQAGAVTRRGSGFDEWDIETRGGALAGVRITTAVEEHGAGRQLLRLRCRPTYSLGAVGLTLVLAVLTVGAVLGGAAPAAIVLGAMTLALGARILVEASSALALSVQALAEPSASDAARDDAG
jgi:hypothetical protein